MDIRLPAATDIYLTGGKTHPSEIRLARFLIRHLKQGDHFLDIGAHYGYFSLLARQLVGEQGTVFAFEASPTTFSLLHKNVATHQNITVLNIAIADKTEEISFFEFPSLYSEYNSMELEQFKQEAWFQKYPPKKVTVPAVDLSSFLRKNKYHPSLIKIDVEGAEFKVIQGAEKYLAQNKPSLILEYLSPQRDNTTHQQAVNLLVQLGFNPFIINQEGTLERVADLDRYLRKKKLDSDNIVFQKD